MENYTDILRQVYRLPRNNNIKIDTQSDAFGLALWTLQLAALKSAFRKAVSKCSEGGMARKYLERILYLLENAFVNKEIVSSSSSDVLEFCDAAQSLSDSAYSELLHEKFRNAGFVALDLLYNYIESLKNGIYRTFDVEDGDFL